MTPRLGSEWMRRRDRVYVRVSGFIHLRTGPLLIETVNALGHIERCNLSKFYSCHEANTSTWED
jgi:hypothetical protein